MPKYEVVSSDANERDANKIIGERERDGWELIPPILMTQGVYTNEQYPSPVLFPALIMTFMKNS